MIIVIAEKPIAGKRIAELLSGNKMVTRIFKTVSFFEFKKNNQDYLVIPLRGHVVNVDFPANYSVWLGTDLKKLVDAEVLYKETEKNIFDLLREKASLAQEVVIATDPDKEGESIGLEAVNAILAVNSKVKITRASFSAITQQDVDTAFAHLTDLDFNLAHSADARREIDLIWGAVLTRYLSLVSGRLGKDFLSVGRVQSPTLALIVAREKERLAFKIEPFFELEAVFQKGKEQFTAQHSKGKFSDKAEAEKILTKKKSPCEVVEVKKSKRILKKPVPFNTTEFLRAATAIGFTAGMAMNIAENLYQTGLTSYPRTDNQVYPDSLNLRDLVKKLREHSKFYPDAEKLLALKKLEASKGKLSKDHPPIHPVDIPKQVLNEHQWKIYELIVRRYFATLAEDAVTDNVRASMDMNQEIFYAFGQTYTLWGWKEFYPYSKSEEMILPELKKGDWVDLLDLKLLSKETKPPARFSQGTLIKLMEELGLGTKATRHEIIQKLYARDYISGKKSIEPNSIGIAVTDTLNQHNSIVVKPEMTAELEKEMDLIATGKKEKTEVIQESREFLHKILQELLDNKDKIGSSLRQALRTDKELMKCTREGCTGKLVIRLGRTGKRFLGCNTYPNCTTTYPLPQQGKLQDLNQFCPECKAPMIKLIGKRYSFNMCINLNCKTKDEWKKKKLEKENESKKVKKVSSK
ncbi:MAG: DNA topoisomerase I [Candidatus Diapherotrites archaeon]|nr:DNA topoisomerase I [Candidatus Diapherotrites archaeon]